MTVQHVVWGKTSWSRADGSPEARPVSRPGLLGRHPLLQRPAPAGDLPGQRRPPPARRRSPIEVIVADDASTDGTADWLAGRPSRRPPRPPGAERRLLRGGQRGDRRRAGRVRPAPEQRHRGRRPAGSRPGLAPFADPTVGSVAPLVLVRSDPSRVDSAGDSYALVGWPSKRGHGQPASRLGRPPRRPRLRRQRVERLLPGRGAAAGRRLRPLLRLVLRGRRPRLPAPLGRLSLRLRARRAGSCTRSRPATTTPARPSSAGWPGTPRSSSGPTCRPPGSLAAIVPHLAFTLAQGLWRLARGRARPFVLGKLDALRELPTLRARRRRRLDLARSAIAPPHFPLKLASLEDVRNHLRRPRSLFPLIGRVARALRLGPPRMSAPT